MKYAMTVTLAALLITASPASAIITTYTSDPISLTFWEMGSNGDIPQLDPALWVLNSATVTVNLEASGGKGEFDNENPGYLYQHLEVGRRATVMHGAWHPSEELWTQATTGLIHLQVGEDSPVPGDDPGEGEDPMNPDWGGPDYLAVVGTTGSDSDFLTHPRMPGWPDPEYYLHPYIGTDPVAFDYESDSYLKVVSDTWPAYRMSEDAPGTMTISVTYDYDIVPEPATLGLLALGACLPLLRRRR